jgi:hypothetical protein
VAQEDVPAAGVTLPELDVADSVRRMLEASRKEPGEAAVEPTSAVPAPAAPVAPPPVVAAPPAAPPVTPVASAAPARPAAPSAPAADYVPLPAGEFTIRGTDDIRALARELEEAKRRHQQR